MSNPALILISGGLDSLLAARWCERAGLRSLRLHFETGFVAEEVQARVELAGPVIYESLIPDYAERLLAGDPGASRGRLCRTILLEAAARIAEREGCGAIVTGDVLGQSECQSRAALEAADRDADLVGRVLRPLSARQLGWPGPEEPLLDLHGSSRRRQLELARDYGLEAVPATKGGCCRLASASFRRRALDCVRHRSATLTAADLERLAWGRRYRLSSRAVLLLSRSQVEARKIEDSLARPAEIVPVGGGPSGWLLGEPDGRAERAALRIAAAGAGVNELLWRGERTRVEAADEEELADTRI